MKMENTLEKPSGGMYQKPITSMLFDMTVLFSNIYPKESKLPIKMKTDFIMDVQKLSLWNCYKMQRLTRGK